MVWTDRSEAWGPRDVKGSPTCLLCVTQTQQQSAANCGQNRQHYPTQLGTRPAASGLEVSIILHIFFKSLMEMFYLFEILLKKSNQMTRTFVLGHHFSILTLGRS